MRLRHQYVTGIGVDQLFLAVGASQPPSDQAKVSNFTLGRIRKCQRHGYSEMVDCNVINRERFPQLPLPLEVHFLFSSELTIRAE